MFKKKAPTPTPTPTPTPSNGAAYEVRVHSGSYDSLLDNYVTTDYSNALDKFDEFMNDSFYQGCNVHLHLWQDGIRLELRAETVW